MTPQPILPQVIDSTILVCARSCMQKAHNEFILGLRPPGISVDLHAGACFATALEVFRKSFYDANLPLEQAKQKALAAYLIEWGDFEIPDFKKTNKTKDRVWDAVEEYIDKFPPATDHVQPYFVSGRSTYEFTFAIPLEPAVNPIDYIDGPPEAQSHVKLHAHANAFPLHPSGDPFIYAGRFDMFGKLQNTTPCILDDKTTGRSISSGWADQWNLRNQFIGYTWACRALGLNLDTVVVRGIAIQKTQISFGEAIKTYSDHLRAKWLEQLRRDLWRIRRAWDEGYWDYNFGDTCTAYGNCMYMDMCASQQPMTWANDFEVRRWSPLDKNPVEPGIAA